MCFFSLFALGIFDSTARHPFRQSSGMNYKDEGYAIYERYIHRGTVIHVFTDLRADTVHVELPADSIE